MRMRLTEVVIAVGFVAGLGTLPAQAQVSDAQAKTLLEAIRQTSSQPGKNGLPYIDPTLAKEIPYWSLGCMGRPLTQSQLEESPVTAQWILVCKLRDVMKAEYGSSGNNEAIAVRRTAAWLKTGNSSGYNTSEAPYTQKVLVAYQQKQPVAVRVVPPAPLPVLPANAVPAPKTAAISKPLVTPSPVKTTSSPVRASAIPVTITPVTVVSSATVVKPSNPSVVITPGVPVVVKNSPSRSTQPIAITPTIARSTSQAIALPPVPIRKPVIIQMPQAMANSSAVTSNLPQVVVPKFVPLATPQPVTGLSSNTYDRYMQAAYTAANRQDTQTALLFFRRALDERPNDPTAIAAIRTLENGKSSGATPPKNSTIVIPTTPVGVPK